MSELSKIVSHEKNYRYSAEVKKEALALLAKGATPAEVEKRLGVSRKTVSTWNRRAQSLKPLSELRDSLPRVVTPKVTSLPTPPFSALGAVALPRPVVVASNPQPCPLGCGTMLDADAPDAELLAHLQRPHNEPGSTQTIEAGTSQPKPSALSQGSPRRHQGPSWYECSDCGGQFEYLRKGGTCKQCESQIEG